MAVLVSARWLALHLLTLVLVAACGLLTWWQFDRAQGGNARSLGYAFQWPAFAIFTIGVWAWLCRDATRTQPRATPAPPASPGRLADDEVLPPVRRTVAAAVVEDDPALAEYNRMLAQLANRDDK
jgi:DNA-binding transcriptional regulator of glucitol operon